MSKLTIRTQRLTKLQQREFINYHIPQRIRVIEECFADQGQNSLWQTRRGGVFTRAIAGFLGFNTRSGRLHSDCTYFHISPVRSWEVKLSDIDGGSCLTLNDLTAPERDALENASTRQT